MVYNDADYLIPHILATAHAAQMTTMSLVNPPRRSENTQAAFLRVQETAARLISTYEEIAKNITKKIS